ncbi:transporter substrate-binding domain-containing protein [Leucobacter allii]|uniref:substrate-binding periplasmic protein n=1 Tax=Leucobacter allii TaxID=2932247 RepID=UPI001FD5FFC6|nr:transporter substrate-binding domain-containing protein [Leucobacter allii]UOR00432.1 transporter substrate-binding domain-containing protein [Leucobacter allii]
MKYRLIRTAALGAAAALLLAGCSTAAEEASGAVSEDCVPVHEGIETITPGVLTVAHYDYPPFAYMEEGEFVGIEGEIIAKIAEMECLDLKLVPGDSSAMITSVQTGRADTTLGSWYRTAERAEVVRLSEPVVTSPLSIVSTSGISTVDELAELDAVGAGQALVGIEELQGLLGARLKLYSTNDAEFADFQSGRIEGAVLGLGAAVTLMELYPVEGATVEPIEPDERLSATVNVGQTNFPVNLENDALGEAIDADIAALREDGTIAELAEQYGFPASIAEPGEANLL